MGVDIPDRFGTPEERSRRNFEGFLEQGNIQTREEFVQAINTNSQISGDASTVKLGMTGETVQEAVSPGGDVGPGADSGSTTTATGGNQAPANTSPSGGPTTTETGDETPDSVPSATTTAGEGPTARVVGLVVAVLVGVFVLFS